MKVKCLIHPPEARSKPGSVLKFSDGSLKLVTRSGALINAVRLADGSLARQVKLGKKERRRQRRAQVPQNQPGDISPVKPASPDPGPLADGD